MDLNLQLFYMVNSMAGKNAGLDAFFRGLAVYSIAIVMVVLVFLYLKKYKRAFATAVISVFLALGINQLISFLYYSPRPFVKYNVTQLISHSPDSSFPSDHTSISFALAFSVLMYHRRMGIALVVFSALVGFSRVYCGVHYPLDIAGGVVTAGISSILAKCITRRRFMLEN